MDVKQVMSGLEGLTEYDWRMYHSDSEVRNIARDALNLLKEQDELLRKLQKDKDKLCLDVSEWKHKYHDRPLKEQEVVPVKEDEINICECGEAVCRYWHPKFCGFCGRELLWY